MRGYKGLTLIIVTLLVFFLIGCARKNENDKVIATVNDAPILLNELQYKIATISKQDPELKLTTKTIEQELNTIIDKKIMIQEAMKLGISKDKKFLNTIRTFWEQTLIKNLIVQKQNGDWKDYIFVKEEEIQNYYEKLQYRCTFKIIEDRNPIEANSMLKQAKKGEVIEWEKIIGPVSYDDLSTKVLKRAFDLEEGEIKVFHENDYYFIIYMENKETITRPPIKEIYQYIKTSILEDKKRNVMEQWLIGMRNEAMIKINQNILDTFVGSDKTHLN